MPTLTWGGKEKVVNHHHDVPLRTLKHKYAFKSPEGTPANSSGNKIIHGDNLEALKALLPEYEGRIKCVYIDPPYNTGNEGWVYNDNVNDPKIRKWLGQVVGKEGEDLTRHDKWLCMIYPRLMLLRRFLRDDGIIFISIDDHEVNNLRLICDEIFGEQNFYGNIVWQKKDTPSNDAKGISITHEYVMMYVRSNRFIRRLFQRTESQISNYKNPDNDPRGVWTRGALTRKEYVEKDYYPIKNPQGREVLPPPGTSWRVSRETLKWLIADNRLWWGNTGNGNMPFAKRFLTEVQAGVVPVSWWDYGFAGSNRNAKMEMRALFGNITPFDTAKPTTLIQRLLSISTADDDLVLDSFAGSGTTAHAVLKLNQQDCGNRKFIVIEMMDYAETITAERVRRVMSGYGENSKAVAGTGGHFDFYDMGEPIFAEDGSLNTRLSVDELRRYIAFTENIPLASQLGTNDPRSPYLLSVVDDTAYFFCYEPEQTTTLDLNFLGALSFKPATLIVYADNCLLDSAFLQRHNIIFKKIPGDVMRY